MMLADIDSALDALGVILNRIETHFGRSEVAFRCVIAERDAEDFVRYLERRRDNNFVTEI